MMKVKTKKRVLDYLTEKSPAWVSPTEIGYEVGGLTKIGSQRHSAWASPICKRLVQDGCVVRNSRGHYRLKGKSDA